MEKQCIEPPEMSCPVASDVERILDLSEIGQNVTVTTSFSEPFITSTGIEPQPDNQEGELLSGLTPLTPVNTHLPKMWRLYFENELS